MTRAVEACVHCGFCLPACPTYRLLGEEMDSPRGRIVLMKSALEGGVDAQDVQPYLDRCLGCLACVPACPSGVGYGDLLTLYRDRVRHDVRRPLRERVVRAVAQRVLPSRRLARLAMQLARLARPLATLGPSSISAMMSLLPPRLPPVRPLPSLTPAIGPRRARVALLEGCVQTALAPDIGWATVRVLARNGVEVVVPRPQGCCGALAIHAGDLTRARRFARGILDGFRTDVDAVIVNAAGCGSGMKEYGLVFGGHPEEPAARRLAGLVQDVAEFLHRLGLIDPPALDSPLSVAYHDACHLAHAQGIAVAPRALLSRIGNLRVFEIDERDVCCGSAGAYNVEQPALAATLGVRKARHILSTPADAVVAGNVGCIVQIDAHLRRLDRPLPVLHTIELLDRAYRSA